MWDLAYVELWFLACLIKFLRALCWAHEHFNHADVILLPSFQSHVFLNLCRLASTLAMETYYSSNKSSFNSYRAKWSKFGVSSQYGCWVMVVFCTGIRKNHVIMFIDWQEVPLGYSAPCSVLATAVNNHVGKHLVTWKSLNSEWSHSCNRPSQLISRRDHQSNFSRSRNIITGLGIEESQAQLTQVLWYYT